MLFIACQQGEEELVRTLLECKVNLYQADNKGNTALIVAAKEGHHGVCKLLRLAGCNHELRNKNRESAYDLAIALQKQEVVRLITPNPSDEQLEALEKELPGAYQKFLELLRASGVGLAAAAGSALDGSASSKLKAAVAKASTPGLEALMHFDAGSTGFTPLMLACHAPAGDDEQVLAFMEHVLGLAV